MTWTAVLSGLNGSDAGRLRLEPGSPRGGDVRARARGRRAWPAPPVPPSKRPRWPRRRAATGGRAGCGAGGPPRPIACGRGGSERARRAAAGGRRRGARVPALRGVRRRGAHESARPSSAPHVGRRAGAKAVARDDRARRSAPRARRARRGWRRPRRVRRAQDRARAKGEERSCHDGNARFSCTRYSELSMGWIVLIYRLPTDDSRARVAVWRELRRSGALHLQQSVVAVPDADAFADVVEQLRSVILGVGGEVTAIRAAPLADGDERRILEAWNAAREDEYRELVGQCAKLVEEID